MAVTIKQIAELSGVSAGTVDRVINKRGRVRPETEEKVKKVADMLGYQPNTIAKSLSLRKKAFTIGVISHVQEDYSNYAVSESLRGIEAGAKEHSDFGISLIVKRCRNFDPIHQIQLIEELLSENVCALAIMPINEPIVSRKLDEVTNRGIPVFCFTNDVDTALPHYYVGIDTYKTGCLAAGLLNLFQTSDYRIAVLISPLTLSGNSQRLKGFTDTLQASYPGNTLSAIEEVADDDIEAYRKTRNLLTDNPDINACFLASGASKGILTALEEAGLLGRIPIVSIDASPPVLDALKARNIAATISQNPFQHGYQTIKTICDMIFNNLTPGNYHVCVDSTILIAEHFL